MVTSYSWYYIVTIFSNGLTIFAHCSKAAISNILNEPHRVILTRQGSELQGYDFPTYNLLGPLGYSAPPFEKNILKWDIDISYSHSYILTKDLATDMSRNDHLNQSWPQNSLIYSDISCWYSHCHVWKWPVILEVIFSYNFL